MKMFFSSFSGRQITIIFLLFVAVVCLWTAVYLHEKDRDVLLVAFLDVGQGDAIFIETPSGTQVLIDGGPNKEVLRELGQVMPFWDRSIDMIITTHPDLDHIGGIPAVLQRFSVDVLIIPGVGAETAAYDELARVIEQKGIETKLARRSRIVLDHDVYLDVLFPDRDVRGVDPNLASVIAKLTFEETSFLFTGDAPAAIESYLVSIYKESLDVDVLKLGHHGSDTSSSLVFLGYTSPEIAVISSGKDNRYGHPHTEVIERLRQLEITHKNTATDGRIVVTSDGERIIVR